jgi:hypothetical protein
MSYASEMLAAVASADRFGTGELAAVIEGCATAAQACTTCADACLAEDDLAGLRLCNALCHTCADVSETTMRTLSRPAHSDHLVLHRMLQACVRSCFACAEECGRHAQHHRHCELCARACRMCLQACTDLLESEAFEELRKLAGG